MAKPTDDDQFKIIKIVDLSQIAANQIKLRKYTKCCFNTHIYIHINVVVLTRLYCMYESIGQCGEISLLCMYEFIVVRRANAKRSLQQF